MNFGKILLIKKKHCPISWFIRWYLGSVYNHVGIFINEDTILEIAALGHRTRKYKAYQNTLLYETKILKIKGISLRKLIDMVVYFSEFKREEYGYVSFIKCLLDILTNKELTRFTCSGFIAYVLELHGIKLVDKYYDKVTPKDFEISNQLE